MKIKIAYFGSPQFSADFLEKILTDQDLKKIISLEFVVTQPDRPVGRKQIISPTPVKKLAQKNKVKVFTNLFDLTNKAILKNVDLAFLYAFSQIIPASFLNLPRLGFWNLHPSLLPKYRGPSPIAYPLILGEKETGVTLIKMDEKIDHGPIIAQEKITVDNKDRRPELEKKLTAVGFQKFKEVLLSNLSGWSNQKKLNLSFTPQNHSQATSTRLLKKDDGFISFVSLKKVLNHQSLNDNEIPLIIHQYYKKYPNEKKIFNFPLLIFNLYRGLYPWPGLWTILSNGKRLKIVEISIKNKRLTIETVKLEGKKEVSFTTFNRGYNFF